MFDPPQRVSGDLASTAQVRESAALHTDQLPAQLADPAGGRGLVTVGGVPVGVRLQALDS